MWLWIKPAPFVFVWSRNWKVYSMKTTIANSQSPTLLKMGKILGSNQWSPNSSMPLFSVSWHPERHNPSVYYRHWTRPVWIVWLSISKSRTDMEEFICVLNGVTSSSSSARVLKSYYPHRCLLYAYRVYHSSSFMA